MGTTIDEYDEVITHWASQSVRQSVNWLFHQPEDQLPVTQSVSISFDAPKKRTNRATCPSNHTEVHIHEHWVELESRLCSYGDKANSSAHGFPLRCVIFPAELTSYMICKSNWDVPSCHWPNQSCNFSRASCSCSLVLMLSVARQATFCVMSNTSC